MNGRTGGRVHAHVAAGTMSQPQRLVLSPHRDRDAMQRTGAWIATADPVDIVQ